MSPQLNPYIPVTGLDSEDRAAAALNADAPPYLLSVIIPCLNEAENIEQCVERPGRHWT